ncbi:MAG: V-type ATPase subunit [Brevinema sp.]
MISFQYIPLSVRVRAWNVSLFSKNDLLELINQDNTELMSRVAQKEKKVQIQTEGQTYFTQSLKRSLLYYLDVATHLSSCEGKYFITELSREYEVENLKLLCRMVLSGKYFGEFIDLKFSSAIPSHKFLETRSFHDFVQLLNGTIYESLIPALQKTEQEKNTLFWETALDNFVYGRLYMTVKRLDHQSRLNAKKVYLLPLQLEQLITIYRYRFHYQLDSSEIFMLVPNVFHLMSIEKWKQIIFSPSSTDFIKYMNEIYHIDAGEFADATELRFLFRKKIEQICRQELHKRLTELSSFLAFYQLKKIQIQKIVTILEAKLLTIDSDINVEQFL